MSDCVKRMDIKEFREVGYLQEANRLFFHPLGLALEVIVEDDGTEKIGGVWDYRDDPEGIVFHKLTDKHIEKMEKVRDLKTEKLQTRYHMEQCDIHGVQVK